MGYRCYRSESRIFNLAVLDSLNNTLDFPSEDPKDRQYLSDPFASLLMLSMPCLDSACIAP
jgi:hypothetical protein